MGPTGPGANQRIDQWLWFARITKSRTLAQALVVRGKVRVNRIKIDKPSTPVKPGDVLTLVLGPTVRSLEIVAIGARRGPATEARLLFNDLIKVSPRASSRETIVSDSLDAPPSGVRAGGTGRPTKRERRQIDRLKSRSEL
ncbi:RNA-binding S4 domain-containing protein [Hyphomicrobium sp.]|jgi:ribosome-associated heat shock protein Hsp15|uniref:RNA-binding S4 domain-containing protein n=1 Tax=Hyphomicrobium sp. TaxID=82 RepID=UPI002BD663CF|nr:RNA-binding S4 domain-containing protein [Hyphomicrobium sp.]HVZ04782.1 RNA-binding S4 domain-containing protein [Hyphomicrobium sp.]